MKRIAANGALIMGITATPSFAQSASISLVPDGTWVVEPAQASCLLSRTLQGQGLLARLRATKSLNTPKVALELLVPLTNEQRDGTGKLSAVFEPGSTQVSGSYTIYTVQDNRQGTFNIDLDLNVGALFESKRVEIRSPVSIIITTPDLRPLRIAFNACTKRYFVKNGADPIVYGLAVTPPKVKNYKAVFSADYRAPETLKKSSGNNSSIQFSTMIIKVSGDGKPEECKAVAEQLPINVPQDNWATKTACKHLRFDPAKDVAGHNVPGYVRLSVTFNYGSEENTLPPPLYLE